MSEQITVTVNGRHVTVRSGTTVAAAVIVAGAHCRRSLSGEARGPLCGMGICFECRVEIDGQRHQRSCQILCSEGMQVSTND